MKIVGISGSLRSKSSNAALLRAASELVPEGTEFVIYEGLGELPHFNPDRDDGSAPPSIQDFRKLMAFADGVVISSPEYAHGVPGSLKNALDWLVSSGELVDKPVLLINASTSGGQRAQASLVQTLEVMSARVLVKASLLAPFVHKKLDPHGNISDADLAEALQRSLHSLASAIEACQMHPASN